MKVIILTILIGFGGALISGTVLSYNWLWFVVPIFNLEPLTIFEATGLGLMIACLTHQVRYKEPEKKDVWRIFKQSYIVKPLTYLLFGYILKNLAGL